MPIELTAEEGSFLERVEGYCRDNLTLERMAAAEGLTLGGFRSKVQRCSFEIDQHTTRTLVRLRTSEPYGILRARGEMRVAAVSDREPVAA